MSRKKIQQISDDEEGIFYESDEYEDQWGGQDNDTDIITDDEVAESIDSDPDEPDDDPDGDGIFDPINEGVEPIDTDEEIGDEDEGTDIDSDDSVNEDGDDYTEDVDAVDTDIEGEFDVDGKPVESRTCYLKNLNKDIIVLDEDDSSMNAQIEPILVAKEDRESDSIMTYYEMVRIIGIRAKHFDYGAEPLVEGLEKLSSSQKAYVELLAGMTPVILRRRLPGKRLEDWKIEELDIIHPINDPFYVPLNYDWDALLKQSHAPRRVAKSAIPHI